MRSRCLTILILASFCWSLGGCSGKSKKSKEHQVIQWLKKTPQDPSEAKKKWGVVPYSSHEEWVRAGRNIQGVEAILIRSLESDHNLDTLESWDVVCGLGYVGSVKSVPVLIRVMQDKKRDYWARVQAAIALGSIGDPAAVQPLCEIVSSDEDDETLKINAVSGLWMIGDSRAIPVIENALKNQAFSHSQSYRKGALRMLDELKQKVD